MPELAPKPLLGVEFGYTSFKKLSCPQPTGAHESIHERC